MSPRNYAPGFQSTKRKKINKIIQLFLKRFVIKVSLCFNINSEIVNVKKLVEKIYRKMTIRL